MQKMPPFAAPTRKVAQYAPRAMLWPILLMLREFQAPRGHGSRVQMIPPPYKRTAQGKYAMSGAFWAR